VGAVSLLAETGVVERGSLFSFLGLRRGVLSEESLVAFSTGFAFDAIGVPLVFAILSFSNTIPPADPALPTSTFGAAALRDLVCFDVGAAVALGPGDDDFDVMVLALLCKTLSSCTESQAGLRCPFCLKLNAQCDERY
jgi:hypothetical protein